MKRLFAYLTLMGIAVVPVWATDYSEEEPNDDFPPNYLTGNPVFQTGDRFVGTVDADADIDSQYLTFQGAGSAGLWRYVFDIDAGGGDSVLSLYDTTASGWFLAINDDFPGLGVGSRLIFDHFDTTGDDVSFGLDVEEFGGNAAFDYAVSWTREEIIPTDLGSLSGASTEDFTSAAGAGTWYAFTLDTDSTVTIDTFASSPDFDSELALFDSDGNTIGGDDDTGDDFLSSISADLTAGTYYLAASSWNGRYDWDNTADTNIGWDRSGFSGGLDEDPFTLTFNVTPVPEPATMAVLGIGALALLCRRRKV